MPEVQDYTSGRILSLINMGFALFKFLKIPILGSAAKQYGLSILRKCDPQKVNADHVVRLIQESQNCAVGPRVCNELNNGADHGLSVFLDELAVGMAKVGKAKLTDKQTAIKAITEDRKGPIIVSKVSGKHMEICRSIPQNCIYWNSEKRGLKCIERKTA